MVRCGYKPIQPWDPNASSLGESLGAQRPEGSRAIFHGVSRGAQAERDDAASACPHDEIEEVLDVETDAQLPLDLLEDR